MQHRTHLVIAIGLCCVFQAPVYAQTDSGLQTIGELAQLNGQALACQHLQLAQRAKGLMLTHAPKSPRFSKAFEDGTQQGYLAQTRGDIPCPENSALSAHLDTLAKRLQADLPPVSKGKP